MVLARHSDADYLDIRKAHSRAGANTMLSENVPVPNINRPFLTITQMIKFVVSSAAESELSGLFIFAKEMLPLHQNLIEMGWPQLKTPIQCNNSTAIGVANETIIPQKTKSIDMQFHWIH